VFHQNTAFAACQPTFWQYLPPYGQTDTTLLAQHYVFIPLIITPIIIIITLKRPEPNRHPEDGGKNSLQNIEIPEYRHSRRRSNSRVVNNNNKQKLKSAQSRKDPSKIKFLS
jgi:hypothetical protein